MSEKLNGFVKNDSKGYGYNYASLGDIVNQGYVIPKMKVEYESVSSVKVDTSGFTPYTNLTQFVYYYDVDLKEWVRGAEVVIPESKGMNKAQLYGSALTYARRYTALMALGLACGDDNNIEDINSDGTKKVPQTAKKEAKPVEIKAMTTEQVEFIANMDKTVKDWIIGAYKVESWEKLNADQAAHFINTYTERQAKKNG